LKMRSVGMLWMPYLDARLLCSSTFTLPIRTRPAYSSDSFSRTGATMRQGPHHSAQKSTTMGPSDVFTSASKLAPVGTRMILLIVSPASAVDARAFQGADRQGTRLKLQSR